MPRSDTPDKFLTGLRVCAYLAALLLITFVFCILAERRIDHANDLRLLSRQYSMELLQSSNDLTRMVRTYAVTGDPVFRRRYEDILAIREGKMERPVEFWRPYWDLWLVDGPPPRPGSGQKIGLLELMRRAGFTDAEFRLLAAAKAHSDSLTSVEFAAMALVESDKARARGMLFDAAYHRAKAGIMKSIDDFITIADARTLETVERNRFQARLLWILFGALALALLLMLRLAYRDMSESQGERERALKDLNESEKRFRLMIEAVSDYAILMLDKDGCVGTWNSGAERLFGYAAGEIIGKHFSVFYPPEEFARGEPAAQLATAAASGRDENEAWRLRKDGVRFWANSLVTPLRDEAGRSHGFSLITRDRTDRRYAEEQLRDKTAILEAELEASIDGVLVVDGRGKKIIQNRRFIEIWRMPQEIAGNPDDTASIHHAMALTKDPQGFLSKIESLYMKPDQVSQDEVELTDGTVLDRYSAPVRDSQGGILGRIWVFRDISERKRAEKERDSLQTRLREGQKMESIGRLAGGVAHDFNNLLGAIRGYADLLGASLEKDDPRREDVMEIVAAGEKAAALTRQLLAFSRRQILNPSVLDLNDVVSGMTKLLSQYLGTGVRLETRLAAEPCPVKFDAGQLDQVLLNLAVNARDAMPQGGTVTFFTERVTPDAGFTARHPEAPKGALVRLAVRDTGSGMSDEVKEHLFEPFYSTKELTKGSGLGLSMVYGIIKQSGGVLEVDSAPGRGTTFNIYLAPAAAHGRAEGARGKDEGAAPGGAECVLLVDDTEANRLTAARILTARGYTVLTASGGLEALSLLERRGKPVDILITDLAMPGMTGQELARTVAARSFSPKTLYVSGSTDAIKSKGGSGVEGKAYLSKPFSADGLLRKVRDVLDGPADKARP